MSKWTLILPCAGKSSRFPGTRPKWMLTTPTGELMVKESANNLPANEIHRTVIGIRREHVEKYEAIHALNKSFKNKVEIIVLDEETNGPADTVRKIIEAANITGPICIKDSDSFINISSLPESSFVACCDLRQHPTINRAGEKSYLSINDQNIVVEISEKSIISNYISIGAYGFMNTEEFMHGYFTAADTSNEIFVSHAISALISEKYIFQPLLSEQFVDVGVLENWQKYGEQHQTIFCDIDGVIFLNQSLYFTPTWDSPPTPITENVNYLRELCSRGAQLVFTTSRPEEFRERTESALLNVGLKFHALVMGCNHAPRTLVNDFSSSNPYPSARSVNLSRNTAELKNLLR